jgi:hypothetical protein
MTLRAGALFVLLLALPALGGGSIDGLRAAQRSAADRVSTLKADQLSRRNELSTVSQRIEQLKATSKGKLLPGGELDSALKRSQELSGALSGLAGQVSTQQSELEAASLALLDGLTQELSRLRAEFDRQSDRAVRATVIAQMKALRAEREAIRATLPATKVPSLDALKPSNDPETLLEQADLLRDNEEKLQRELKALDVRIGERRQEADLDRRVQRFMGEESLFDDQDRRLRVQRITTQAAGSDYSVTTPRLNDTAGSPPAGPRELATPAVGGYDSTGIKVTSGADARPQVGGAGSLSSKDDDLAQLERERLKLKALGEQLKQKAAELEKRAAELK